MEATSPSDNLPEQSTCRKKKKKNLKHPFCDLKRLHPSKASDLGRIMSVERRSSRQTEKIGGFLSHASDDRDQCQPTRAFWGFFNATPRRACHASPRRPHMTCPGKKKGGKKRKKKETIAQKQNKKARAASYTGNRSVFECGVTGSYCAANQTGNRRKGPRPLGSFEVI